jgi:RNA polymerase sigma-70 factor (sigma-E family)
MANHATRRGRAPVPDRSPASAVRLDFEEFVRANWATLMSIGAAVSGSRGEAEDLVQTALTNAYSHWRRIRRDEALAYVRRSILNANVSRWRRRGGGELSLADVPDRAGRPDTQAVDDRQSLLPLLRALPPGQRAVLVLRYLCDLADDEVATTLGISAGTVRSQASRGLATIRHASLHQSRTHEEVTR